MPHSLPFVVAFALLAATAVAQQPAQFVDRTPPPFRVWSLRELAVGDFDGDGDIDICGGVGISSAGPRNVLLRNDGQERFTDVTATAIPVAGGDTLRTVVFDIDGDGDLDLFFSKQSAPSLLLRNNGIGVFTDASANLPATATNHSQLVVADLDGDSDFDLAAARGSAVAGVDRVFVNDGTGLFSEAPLAVPVETQGFVGVDFDGDGDVDLVAGANVGPRFLRNDGNLVFTDVSAAWFSGNSTKVQDIAAGDLDGDGDLDLVCGRQAPSDLVLRNTGTAFVTITALASGGVGGTASVALLDCDDDGDLDVARTFVSILQPVALALNDGTGVVTPAPWRMPSTATGIARVYAADLDRDGDGDLLVTQAFGAVLPNTMLMNRHRDLQSAAPVVGQPWTIAVWSEPGYATLDHTCRLAIALATLPTPQVVPGFGELWLDLGAGYLLLEGVAHAQSGNVAFTVPVPPLPQLFGLGLHLQAVAEQARHPARFTAPRSVVVQ